MANKNAISPYARLQNEARSFIYKAWVRKKVSMFCDLKKGTNYSISEILERTKAADQLGYEVLIVPKSNDTFDIVYREKFPEIPFKFRY